ncbi:MAG: hypothetical protein WCW29_03850 [Candidatus Paceibacterota bacterium]|jgi:hypothetical protein
MKKIILFYIGEILIFYILPRIFLQTDVISYLFIGFVCTLPFTVLILVVLYKYFKEYQKTIILHWLLLLIEILVGFYLIIAYSAARSIMSL